MRLIKVLLVLLFSVLPVSANVPEQNQPLQFSVSPLSLRYQSPVLVYKPVSDIQQQNDTTYLKIVFSLFTALLIWASIIGQQRQDFSRYRRKNLIQKTNQVVYFSAA